MSQIQNPVSQAPSIHRGYVAIFPQINARAVYVAALPPARTHRPTPIPTLSPYRCGYHYLLAARDLDTYGNALGSLRARAIGQAEFCGSVSDEVCVRNSWLSHLCTFLGAIMLNRQVKPA